MLESFYFDILMIIVLIYVIVMAMIRGFYHQLLSTIALALPLLVVYFFKDKIQAFLTNLSFFKLIVNYGYKVGRYFLNLTLSEMETFMIIIFTYLISHLIIKIILNIFFDSKKKHIVVNKTPTSRLLAIIFGICNAYIIFIILFILITPIIPIGTGPLLTQFLKIVPKVFVLRM